MRRMMMMIMFLIWQEIPMLDNNLLMLISRFGHRGNILFHLLQVFPFGRRHLFRWIIRRHLFRWIIHNYLGGESGTNYKKYTKISKYYSQFFWAGSWMSTKLSLLERKVRILKYFIQSKHSYGGFLFFCRCHFEQCICGTNHKILCENCCIVLFLAFLWKISLLLLSSLEIISEAWEMM